MGLLKRVVIKFKKAGIGTLMAATMLALFIQPSFAAPAQKVAFVGSIGAADLTTGPHAVFTANADGTDLQQLTNLTAPQDVSILNQITVSPDHTKIAFVVSQPDGSRLYGSVQNLAVINMDGTGYQQLTNYVVGSGDSISYMSNLSWSPDGTKIAYITEDNYLTYYDVSAGTEQHVAQDSDMLNYGISWAPDSQKLAYLITSSTPATGNYIVTINTGGISKTQLTTPKPIHPNVVPQWSPDGNWIAYIMNNSTDPYDLDVHVIDPSGTTDRTLSTDHSVSSTGSLSWSPDSATLIYDAFNDATHQDSQIRSVHPDGTGETVLKTLTGLVSGPTYDAAGQQLAYVQYSGSTYAADIYTMGSNGSAGTQTTTTTNVTPLFTPVWVGSAASSGGGPAPGGSGSTPANQSTLPDTGLNQGLIALVAVTIIASSIILYKQRFRKNLS